MFTPFTIKGCSLELLKPAEKGIITFCNITHEQIRKQLLETGVDIGNKITVIQKFPVLQIKVNDINIAINIETARAIYVRIIDNE
ncbi:FeoA domain-containing protein [Calothrix sp. NIES-2100]|uniref:FeoA domain-containing protein n=1 Tax=Calothrix sp. NIES-2100 TaxID=1954172 RepID=UPI000BBBD07C